MYYTFVLNNQLYHTTVINHVCLIISCWEYHQWCWIIFCANIYHRRYDMITFKVEDIINDVIWYFSANIYHQWYNMIFVREYMSSMIQYDNCFSNNLEYWVQLIKTKLSLPPNSSILKKFEVLFWLTDFVVLKFWNFNTIFNMKW